MSAVMSHPAFDSIVSIPSDQPRSIDELDRAICTLARQMNAESHRMLVLVREFDERLGWAKWSFKSCAEWFAWRCGLSQSAAREKVRTAHALRHLPAIAAAFADGRLSYSKVRALTRVAQPQDEDLLLAYALEATVDRVEERCRQIRNVEPESAHRARSVWERRSLWIWRDDTRGTLRISVEVPIEEGELIAKAIDCAVAAGEVSTGVEPDLNGETKGFPWRAQQADALVAVAKSYLSGGGAGGERASTADHTLVVVHVDEAALRDGAGRSDLPIDTIKRLACDGSVVTVVEGERGEPLDVGRKQRVVSTALRRALYARDRGCTFPGCQRRRYLDAHHLHHWADGGETNPDNLTLLCTYHHRLLHEGSFKIEREGDGSLRYLRADGRPIPRGGYRLEDFTDDGWRPTDENPSREGFCTTAVQHSVNEIRETAAVYRVTRLRPR
jgi:hypothetical protein